MSNGTPRAGSKGTYQSMHGNTVGFTVVRVEDNLCWSIYDNDHTKSAQPFIWRFKDGLNKLHDWPGKPASTPECPYCGTTHGLRVSSEGCGSVAPDYICEDCFTGTDTGPCFDDLPAA